MSSRPSFFICSSSGASDIAGALQENLTESSFEVEIWNQGTFGLSRHILDSLVRASKKFQLVILVLTPDDLVISQDNTYSHPRDNVVFELGFFIGVLGLDRTFIVYESSSSLKLPSYIDGVGCAKFTRPNNVNLTAALGSATEKIKRAAMEVTHDEEDDIVERLVTGALTTVCRALAMPLRPEEAKLRAFIFKKIDSKLICTQFWAPYDARESIGLSFDINSETEKQVAVVKAAVKKQACAVSVSVLPENLHGVHGDIDRDLCFILAAPILGPKGKVWGTVDIDASTMRGENILRHEIAQSVLFELGKHLYWILSVGSKKLAPSYMSFVV